MEIIEGNALANLCDYSFGDHHVVWDSNLTGTYEPANFTNAMFLAKCREFEGKVMTLFIDNIRLYPRNIQIETKYPQDATWLTYLMQTNDLLGLCAQLTKNKFVIFTSHEDTPIDDQIKVPDNVLGVHAVNALYNNDKIHPLPIGLQRQIGKNDKRLSIMKFKTEYPIDATKGIIEPKKLLYVNCGLERNPERAPLAKFDYSWCTTRFDKDSKFYPYERYNEFLDELQDHKFVVCPKGHGYDTHRIWETIYMRRVPIMIDDPYFHKLLNGFPVCFIDKWESLDEQFLKDMEIYYKEAQTIDLNKLDLNQMYENIRFLYVL